MVHDTFNRQLFSKLIYEHDTDSKGPRDEISGLGMCHFLAVSLETDYLTSPSFNV